MATHYRCDPLSDQQAIEYAVVLRSQHGLSDESRPDVMSALKRDTIQTRYGPKSLRFRVVDDGELGDDEAITKIEPHSVEVVVSSSTHFGALVGDGRARMTLAHELAHAVLHKNHAPLARARVDADHRTFVRPFEDVEHQAKVFASYYLISEAAVARADGPPELAVAIGLTHDVERQVFAYVKRELPTVGEVLRLTPARGPGQHSVAGGQHPFDLAQAVVSAVRAEGADKPRRVHLFIAAPNAFTFMLGQRHKAIGRSVLYEFDFDRGRGGSYRRSLELPTSATRAATDLEP